MKQITKKDLIYTMSLDIETFEGDTFSIDKKFILDINLSGIEPANKEYQSNNAEMYIDENNVEHYTTQGRDFYCTYGEVVISKKAFYTIHGENWEDDDNKSSHDFEFLHCMHTQNIKSISIDVFIEDIIKFNAPISALKTKSQNVEFDNNVCLSFDQNGDLVIKFGIPSEQFKSQTNNYPELISSLILKENFSGILKIKMEFIRNSASKNTNRMEVFGRFQTERAPKHSKCLTFLETSNYVFHFSTQIPSESLDLNLTRLKNGNILVVLGNTNMDFIQFECKAIFLGSIENNKTLKDFLCHKPIQ